MTEEQINALDQEIEVTETKIALDPQIEKARAMIAKVHKRDSAKCDQLELEIARLEDEIERLESARDALMALNGLVTV